MYRCCELYMIQFYYQTVRSWYLKLCRYRIKISHGPIFWNIIRTFLFWSNFLTIRPKYMWLNTVTPEARWIFEYQLYTDIMGMNLKITFILVILIHDHSILHDLDLENYSRLQDYFNFRLAIYFWNKVKAKMTNNR